MVICVALGGLRVVRPSSCPAAGYVSSRCLAHGERLADRDGSGIPAILAVRRVCNR